MLGFDMHWL